MKKSRTEVIWVFREFREIFLREFYNTKTNNTKPNLLAIVFDSLNHFERSEYWRKGVLRSSEGTDEEEFKSKVQNQNSLYKTKEWNHLWPSESWTQRNGNSRAQERHEVWVFDRNGVISPDSSRVYHFHYFVTESKVKRTLKSRINRIIINGIENK